MIDPPLFAPPLERLVFFGDRPQHEEYLSRFNDQHHDLDSLLSRIDTEMASSANDQDKRSSTHSIAANIEDTTDSKSTPGAVRRSEQPENIGRYRIQRVLGKGAFACVYLAYDEELHREVAIEFAETMQVFAGHRCEVWGPAGLGTTVGTRR